MVAGQRHADCSVHEDIQRLYEKTDDTNKLLGKLTTAVETNIALCKQCRPKVLGNGHEGLETRLARVEESRAVSKWFLTILVAGGSAVGSLVGAVVNWLGK